MNMPAAVSTQTAPNTAAAIRRTGFPCSAWRMRAFCTPARRVTQEDGTHGAGWHRRTSRADSMGRA